MSNYTTFFLILFLYLSNFNALCMEHTAAETSFMDLFYEMHTKVIACCDTPAKKNLGLTCTALHNISKKNNCDIYTHSPLILTKEQKEYALLYATYRGHIHAVENLLKNEASVAASWSLNVSPLAIAEQFSNAPIITLLKNYGAQAEEPLCSLALIAAYMGDLPLLELCMEYKQMYNLWDTTDYDYTMLHLAIFNGHGPIVTKLLHDKTIDSIVNYPGCEGLTALHIATIHGQTTIVEQLCQIPEINVNPLFRESFCPLLFAIHYEYDSIVKLLLKDPTIDVNECTEQEDSCLHVAADRQNINIMQMLLDAKEIDVNIINDENETALDIAKQYANQEMIRLLRRHGAKTAFYLQRIAPWNKSVA